MLGETKAAALLLTTTPPAPVSRQIVARRAPRAPRPPGQVASRFVYPDARAATRAVATAASGARPRFVWTMTPVALMTATSEGAYYVEARDRGLHGSR